MTAEELMEYETALTEAERKVFHRAYEKARSRGAPPWDAITLSQGTVRNFQSLSSALGADKAIAIELSEDKDASA